MTDKTNACCGPDCCGGDATTTTLVRSSVDAVRATVRERYSAAAARAAEGKAATCGCGTTACSDKEATWDPITSDLYDAGQTEGLPAEALLASLGCGNPTALAELHEGETVLDLGSGGGIDVLLSARRVGPKGRAYGLDMTDAMLALANENQKRAGLDNVVFLKGEIEHIPLPSSSVDVIISNCVINLSGDKPQVIREAFRVLRPGGRFAVSDVVLTAPLPTSVANSVALWTGCVSGALLESEYRTLLSEAGFTDVDVEPTRVYTAADAEALLVSAGLKEHPLVAQVDGKVMSAFVRAKKPVA